MKKKQKAIDEVKDFIEPRAKLVKQSICSCGYLVQAIKTVCLVAFYYVFSISLTFYNQRYIHAYKLPLSITMTHLVSKFMMSGLVRWVYTCITKKERVTIGWVPYIKRVAPPGIAASLDIALSNWSFEFITISLYTMTKSTVIIFILAFSIIFRLEKPRCSLVFVVLFISVGLFLFNFESTQFNVIGFSLVLGASFLSGLRWTLAQMVLQKDELGLTNPLDMMYHLQPWMMLSLLPLSAPFEGVHMASTENVFRYTDTSLLLENLAILSLGACLAFMLELSEFLLVVRTSSLTLSVSGIVKEVFTLLLASLINGDTMSSLNVLGLLVCLLGITLHVILKAIHGQASVKTLHEDTYELLKLNGDANVESDEEEIFNAARDR